jgi:hypothetical protein
MRLTFALLVLTLIAVTAWATWDDVFPEWRRYQRQLVEREAARLEEELVVARRELERPEVRAELERLDARLRRNEADPTVTGRLAAVREELAAIEARAEAMRTRLRVADRRLREPDWAARKEAIEERLDAVQRRYAAASGTWPPDTLRMDALWAERDSLADELLAVEAPVRSLRDSVEADRAEARTLRMEAQALTTTRDSLEAERARLLEPVTTREAALARLRGRPIRIREIVSVDGREVARCPTCHGALDDPPGVHPALPAAELFREVPCTVCHRGSGRALEVKSAHRGLLAGGGFGAGPFSLRARIDSLLSADPLERHAAREELQRITGADPAAFAEEPLPEGADADSAEAARWARWWGETETWFEPGVDLDAEDDGPLEAAGVDPWLFSVRGRTLRYVGSRVCLGCHEVQHREHSRRWMATKFRSIERLVDVDDPAPCLECHATGYDPATGTYAEPGVTCEGCHGPGERYNEMMVAGQELLGRGDELRGNALLNRASRLARDAASRRTVPGDYGPINVCVRCHHPLRHRDVGPGILERDRPVAPEEVAG